MSESTGGQLVGASRVCAVLVTDKMLHPKENGFDGKWVVHGDDGKLALEPVQSMLNIPAHAVLTPTVGDGALLLQTVKRDLMPDMTDYSGVNICVVHTEALMDPRAGALVAQVLLFPVGFVTIADMQASNMPSSLVPETTGDGIASESKVISIVPREGSHES